MSQDSLRFAVIDRLRIALRNRDIAEFAHELGVPIYKDGKWNKGWVGQTIDRIAKTALLSAQQPDGDDFELKSVHLQLRHDEWVPKDTIAITMFNPTAILTETFDQSPVWHKLQRMILVGHVYPDGNREHALVKFIAPVDVSDPAIRTELETYWCLIQDIVRAGSISTYSSKGTSNGFIQLRTKGSGTSTSTCPITGAKFNTRAFYATKRLIRYVRGTLQ